MAEIQKHASTSLQKRFWGLFVLNSIQLTYIIPNSLRMACSVMG